MLRLIAYGGLTAALVACGNFAPVFGFIGLILSPLPLAILGCNENRNRAGIAELIAEALLLLLVSPYMALYFFVGYAPVAGMICALKDLQKAHSLTAGENILAIFTVSIIAKLILMSVFWYLTGHNAMFPDAPQLEVILNEVYREQPALLEALQMTLYLFPNMIPLLVILYCGIEAFLNYSLCVRLTRKRNFFPEIPNFLTWRFPNSILFALLFALIMGFFTDFRVWEEGAMFAFNLQLLLNVFVFLQGLSFLFWLITVRFKFGRLAKIFACLALVFPITWLFVIMAGMGDIMSDFREKFANPKS